MATLVTITLYTWDDTECSDYFSLVFVHSSTFQIKYHWKLALKGLILYTLQCYKWSDFTISRWQERRSPSFDTPRNQFWQKLTDISEVLSVCINRKASTFETLASFYRTLWHNRKQPSSNVTNNCTWILQDQYPQCWQHLRTRQYSRLQPVFSTRATRHHLISVDIYAQNKVTVQ